MQIVKSEIMLGCWTVLYFGPDDITCIDIIPMHKRFHQVIRDTYMAVKTNYKLVTHL